MRAQVPRTETTRLPATFELPSVVLAYSLSLHPRETLPFAFFRTWMGSEPLGNVPAFESCHVWDAPLGRRTTVAPGKFCLESTAATLMVCSPVEGDPTM